MKGFVVFASLVMIGMATTASAQLFGTMPGYGGTIWQLDPTTGAATKVVDVKYGLPIEDLGYSDIEFLNDEAYITSCWTGGATLDFGKVNLTTGQFTPLNDQNGSLNWWGLAYIPSTGLFYTIDFETSRFLSVTPDGTITDIGFNDWGGTGMAYDSKNDTLYVTDGSALVKVDYHTGDPTLIKYLPDGIQGGGHGDLAYDPFTDTLYGNYRGSLYIMDPNLVNDPILVGSNNALSPLGFPIDGLGFRAVPEPGSMVALGLGVVALLRRRKRRA